MQSLVVEECPHTTLGEIGQDVDMDGHPLRLIRCHQCGLLMREYIPPI